MGRPVPPVLSRVFAAGTNPLLFPALSCRSAVRMALSALIRLALLPKRVAGPSPRMAEHSTIPTHCARRMACLFPCRPRIGLLAPPILFQQRAGTKREAASEAGGEPTNRRRDHSDDLVLSASHGYHQIRLSSVQREAGPQSYGLDRR